MATDPNTSALLNAQPYQINLPTGAGLFRAVGDYGNTLYYQDGNQYKALNLTDQSSGLFTPQEQANMGQFGNAGGIANTAIQRLQSQYGLNYNSLPQVNLGDYYSTGKYSYGGALNLNDIRSLTPTTTSSVTVGGADATLKSQIANLSNPNIQALGQVSSTPVTTPTMGAPNANIAPGPGTPGYTYVNGKLTSVGGVPIVPTYTPPSSITGSNLGSTQTTQYTQPQSTNNGASTLSAMLTQLQSQMQAPLGQNQQQASDLTKAVMALNTQEAGKAGYQNEQNNTYGVTEKQNAVNDLQSQLQTILNEHAAAQLQDQQGQGVTTAIDSRQRDFETRQSAIKALSLNSLIAAANSELTNAQNLANKAVALKFDPIEAQIKAGMDNLNLLKNDPATTAEEQKRVAAQTLVLDQAKAQLDTLRTLATDVSKVAVTAASYIGNFTPTAQYPTSSLALQAIQNSQDPVTAQMIATMTGLSAPTVKTGTWSTPYMLGGDYVQKNDVTGEVRTAVNVAANGPGSPTSAHNQANDVASAILDFQNKIQTKGWAGANPDAYAYYRQQLSATYGASAALALDKAMLDAGITVDYTNK